MRPDEWLRVKEIFAAALPLREDARVGVSEPRVPRPKVLREQVEILLASHDRSDARFLESSPMSLDSTLDGLLIGPYQLSSRIGAGGMGEVYKARDTRLDRMWP